MPNNSLENRYTAALELFNFYREVSINFPCNDWVKKLKKSEEEVESIKKELCQIK